MDNIEYLEPPLIKEILSQQRLILEMQAELLKIMAQPLVVYTSKPQEPVPNIAPTTRGSIKSV